MKKYILFDNDGVLVDTEIWYFEANKKALKELGLTLHMDTYQEIMARGGTAWEVAIAQGIETSIIDKKRVQRDIYYQDFLQTKNQNLAVLKLTTFTNQTLFYYEKNLFNSDSTAIIVKMFFTGVA